MPPKGKKDEAPPQPTIVQRPCTANDLEIVSTVKELQGLVNTEVKWRNRVSSAKHISQVSHLKMVKLRSMIDTCKEGIKALGVQLEDFFAALQEVGHSNAPVNVSSAGLVTRAVPAMAAAPLNSPAAANPPPVKAAGGGPPGGGGAGKGGAAASVDDAPNADALARRKEQLQSLASMLLVYYQLPRLSKERASNRPQNPNEMQREFDLALKLAAPNASQQESSSGGALGSKSAGKAPPGGLLRPPKAPKPTDSNAGGFDPYLGDLPSSDFFVLPIPKGVDSSIMQYVFLLRSKRLRLEQCMALFEHELEPLQRRVTCSSGISVVGTYSLDAVGPLIQKATNHELALQKVRQQEDQAFLLKKQATTPAASPATGKK